MPKCGKIGAASTAGWGAGAAIFSPVGRVVLLQKGGSPPQTPPPLFGRTVHPDAIGSLHLEAPTEFRHCLLRSKGVVRSLWGTQSAFFKWGKTVSTRMPATFWPHTPNSEALLYKWGKTVSTKMPAAFLAAYAQFWRPYTRLYPFGSIRLKLRGSKRIGEWVNRWIVALTRSKKRLSTFWFYFQKVNRWIGE